jgi:hypothetical protein
MAKWGTVKLTYESWRWPNLYQDLAKINLAVAHDTLAKEQVLVDVLRMPK